MNTKGQYMAPRIPRATGPSNQPPPHEGWRYDPSSRGWYAPGARSYKSASDAQKLSRRQYDKQYGALAQAGLPSYEAKAKERQALGIPKGAARGHKTTIELHGWTHKQLRSLAQVLRAIAKLGKDRIIVVDAYGVAIGVSASAEEDARVWRALGTGARKSVWTRSEIVTRADILFGSYLAVEAWQVRYKL